MSRRSIPRITSTDLCDHADQDRVERVWQRLEASLPAADARPPRRMHWATIAAAAALVAFGGGILVGKSYFGGSRTSLPVAPTNERIGTDVLAAGESARSFPLDGGGRITLKPGSIVEVQRAGGGVTLKLAQGDATLETPGGGAGPTVVVGDARLDTQASSTVTVSRHLDNIDVGVSRGGAVVASPSMNKTLASGDNVSLPVRTASITSTATPAVALAPHAHHAEVAAPEASVAAAAPVAASDWQRSYQSGDFKAAAAELLRQRGTFDTAIHLASSAGELYQVYDLASKEKESAAAFGALRRIADDFPNDKYAVIAAHQLCTKLAAAEGQKYCKQDTNSPLFDPEAAACRALSAAKDAGNKDEAARLAQEYVNSHADGGTCRDEAEGILSRPADSGDAGAAKVDPKSKPAPKP